ncbi:beta strand repeat-containing protein [Flavobacterium urumqiense]|uniref:Head domain of trimeric autotransporter adhesin n=1 Tax=Flavobacterium urumqiense TaxID=935224 RepID=A0A1H5SL26_9FLAO|nr:hypothetical protein [Flavobacterium urumqiense]SEF51150.1 hypothetical protein SAMN04488130_101337 [Flavobacterium urumqiense]
MKKLLLLLLLIQSTILIAQAPQGFNYQATVRNGSGGLITNQNVNFKFNVMQNTPTSVPVFSETHFAPTDDLGAVNLVIGKGTATTGTFPNIDWGNGNYYLGIELNTGSGYVAMGTTQLLSVPYALYAKSSGTNATVGAISAISTVNGASITSGELNLSPADATNGGIITTGIQTIAGAKTFSSDLNVNGATVGKGTGNNIYNTAIGTNSLASNTTGQWNTANGYTALKANTTGSSNTAIGLQALLKNTIGNDNNAIGDNALYNNTTGNDNIAIGVSSLQSNTTGDTNIAIGTTSLTKNTTGFQNIANGGFSLNNNTTGSNNIANGVSSLSKNTTGSNNTAIGAQALSANILGNGNTAIGYWANTIGDLTNATAIGNGAKVSTSNTIQLGDTNVTSVSTSGNYTGKAFVKTGGTASQYLMADGSVSDTGAVSQNKGKPSIMISGKITDAQAAAQIAAEFGPHTENIFINNTTGLTYIDLSMIVKLIELRISNNMNLTRINLKYLSETYGTCLVGTNPLLSTIDLPALTSIGSGSEFIFSNNALPSSFINTFLNRLLNVTPTSGKYIILNQQNPPAPPTGQGIIDLATLKSAGNSVYTD